MTRFGTWALGYPDHLCVRPGATVRFHVSGAGAETVDAQLVRLIHGDTQPGGPGFREVEVPSDLDGSYALVEQPTHHGSYARLPGAGAILSSAAETGISLFAMVQPRADTGVQPVFTAWDVVSESGVALALEPGLRPAFWTARGRVALPEPLLAGVWYALCGSWDPARGTASVRAIPVVNAYNSQFGPVTQVARGSQELPGAPCPLRGRRRSAAGRVRRLRRPRRARCLQRQAGPPVRLRRSAGRWSARRSRRAAARARR